MLLAEAVRKPAFCLTNVMCSFCMVQGIAVQMWHDMVNIVCV